MSKTTYRVNNVLDKSLRGWLPVTDTYRRKLEIFYTTLVQPNDQFTEFEILEGFHKSKRVVIDYQSINPRIFSAYLDKRVRITNEECFLFIELENNKLLYKAGGRINELYVQAKNLDPGKYLILFPDRRHTDKISQEYIRENSDGSRFAETWFPLLKEKFEFQYLHFGTYSNGCATVLSHQGQQWNHLYNYIVKSRYLDCAHGTLVVAESMKSVLLQHHTKNEKHES